MFLSLQHEVCLHCSESLQYTYSLNELRPNLKNLSCGSNMVGSTKNCVQLTRLKFINFGHPNVYRAELKEKLMKLKEKGINSLAVVLMHSYMNKVNIKIILILQIIPLSLRVFKIIFSSNYVCTCLQIIKVFFA